MENGKVSIIVPCYNQAEYLAETLDSVLAQTYQNWECVIVNDGSLDNTEEIVNEFLAKDKRFKYIRKENEGVSVARNVGVSNSNGEFVLPLDGDDLIDSTYIDKAVGRFTQFPETKLVYCKADIFGKCNGYWDLEEYDYERFIWKNCIFCAAMFRRADYDQTHGYNVNMIYGSEDWDFWLTLLNKDDLVHRIDEVLFHYRVIGESRTTLAMLHLQESRIQICKNHPEIYSPYYNRIFEYHDEVHRLICELKQVQASRAYRLGKLLLKPFSWLRSRSS